ncbi:hypothetical protein [Pseudosulfitobacter pseudonitzschiae]|uniref:hypothetical protein n=1 Tax=Pseudosulfitobacter pseudonitzschiae TaxID=1402135 RepID=UPI001AF2D8D9|nr:hypothetical protein [Pseudosulfitobacter pseudonitzschiae]MBM1815920.1 hypothetical protein [Pseudosulfitobacter pseudonitzschiae]MBM1832911.1 hypothetical protein [Pseudosulfitobacter pseudonitzschiae]MBM1837779.1 hypothetical protein [Pseudosulfitobacter pseudonitzschiae]MBM1842625.1 hypothetical protein [Pseudosulfitobacter pseudonitzschiae]MBM1847493.1 hypothetical protein [Pseudosulfitobacter pseudonitzschiae]
MSPKWPWSELGLAKRATEREVKRAYAARLKQIDRNDPAAFGALRDAFAAAKNGALKEKAAPKRPRMADIAEGRTGQDDAAPITLREPQRAPEPLPQAPIEHTPAPEAAQPQPPHTDDAGHQPFVQELFADMPEPPKAPAPKPAQPWGVGIGQLDALAQEDPDRARSIFQTKFNDALRNLHWDTKALDALLSLDMAHDLTLRRSLEAQLYDTLQTRLNDPETGYPVDMARVIETHFQWATDGVGASKRLGWRRDYQLLMYGHARSVPQSSKPRIATRAKDKQSYVWHKISVFAVLFLLTISIQEMKGADDYIVVSVALAVLFMFVRWLTMLGAAIIVKLASLLRLNRPAIRLAHWAFPATTAKLTTSLEFRKLGIFALTAVVMVALYLIDKYA